jgi:hypothetical protein
MTKKFPLALSLLLLASPAVAMTPKAGMIHAKTPAATQTAAKKPAARPKTTTASATAVKKPMRHHRVAKKVAMRGHREVAALNALESNGYRQFANLHAQGSDFVATANKNGKSYDVTVAPSGAIQAASA